MKTPTRRKSLLIGVLAALSVTQSVTADEIFYGTRTPTVNEFVEGLTPALRFRGIKPTASAAAEPVAVSMQLQFAFDSFELSDESRATLDNLSAALKSNQLSGFNFLIEGHTDAIGPESYNLSLSEKRAKSVMDYLTTKHGIEPYRLRTIGKGEGQLLDPADPAGGENRRVAIVNVGETMLGGN